MQIAAFLHSYRRELSPSPGSGLLGPSSSTTISKHLH